VQARMAVFVKWAGDLAVAAGHSQIATLCRALAPRANQLVCRDFVPKSAAQATAENRGVPGSSPGLAIGKHLQMGNPRLPVWQRSRERQQTKTGR
jgi:hypothetical protein